MADIGGIARALEQAAETVPGLVAMATTAESTLYHGAFGKRDLSTGAAMTEDTIFALASMTKAITSAAAMQLVEQGRLSLDAPIGDVLPELANPQVITGFAADGAPKLRPAARPVTLRQLLTHSAGYGYPMWNPEIGAYLSHTKLPRAPTNWEEAARMPLLFDPGEKWNYGINTDIVGKAVEAVSGQLLNEYWHDHVLGPLGMYDTDVVVPPSKQPRMVRNHGRQADGSLQVMDFPPTSPSNFCMGGGALLGTAADYLRFTRMILNGGTLDGVRILAPETVADMARNHLGALDVLPMHTQNPVVTNDANFFPGMVQKWGLGFLINTERGPSGRSAGSLAWAGIRNTYYWIDPKAGVAGVILMQILPFADGRALDALWAFERAVYDTLD